MRSKLSLIVILGLLTIPTITLADSLSVGQIAQELKQDAVVPLAPSVGNQLAKNLLAAQAAAPYTQFEPDSLQLSIDSVPRAIGLYAYPGGPAMITDEASEPGVWIQSRIAIDDRLTVSLTPGSLDFGSQPVATPEPSGWLGLLLGFALLATWQLAIRNPRFRDTLLIGNSLECETRNSIPLR
jgi:hypothetical protein